MNEETNNVNAATIADDMDINLGDIDLSRPRLVKDVYNLKITSAERRQENDNDYLLIGMETTNVARTEEGESLPVGWKCSAVVGVKPFENETQTDANKRLATVVQAAKLKCTKNELLANPAILVDIVVPVRVNTYTSKKTGEKQNGFNFLAKK